MAEILKPINNDYKDKNAAALNGNSFETES
jgi:hypothetical protein